MLDVKVLISKLLNTSPIGRVDMYAGSTAPKGWLLCQGQAVSRTDYKALFDVIGTTYGAGDGSTTFNLPDMRDRFPVGAGSSYAVNATGGANTVTLTTTQIPAHTHGSKTLTGTYSERRSGANGAYDSGWTGGIVSTVRKNSGSAFAPYAMASGSVKGDVHTINATHEHASVGGGGAHENRPPYRALNFIIYAGV